MKHTTSHSWINEIRQGAMMNDHQSPENNKVIPWREEGSQSPLIRNERRGESKQREKTQLQTGVKCYQRFVNSSSKTGNKRRGGRKDGGKIPSNKGLGSRVALVNCNIRQKWPSSVLSCRSSNAWGSAGKAERRSLGSKLQNTEISKWIGGFDDAAISGNQKLRVWRMERRNGNISWGLANKWITGRANGTRETASDAPSKGKWNRGISKPTYNTECGVIYGIPIHDIGDISGMLCDIGVTRQVVCIRSYKEYIMNIRKSKKTL